MAGPTLGGSLRILGFKGIDVHVHWTFLLLVGYVAVTTAATGAVLREVLLQLAYVGLVFACVVLHEYGHALTALRYGVRTRDITLLPIGGVASLERMPEEPAQEFWITMAGPLVNLVLAVLAGTVQWFFFGGLHVLDPREGAAVLPGLLSFLFTANLSLFLFNLLPAFPMDGGRILRALLSLRLPRVQATRIATGVGRALAAVLGIGGLYFGEPMLALIGVFIWFAAGAEARAVIQQTALRGITAAQVMRTRFWALPGEATVGRAVDELLAGGDQDLLVVESGKPVGLVTRRQLMEALRARREERPLREVPPTPVEGVPPGMGAQQALQQLALRGLPLLPVVDGGVVVGVLEPDNLAEFLQVQGMRARQRPGA
ncbi:MAG: site-2 protease family protein [Flavobacteriales bacterium]|nr:putative zinc metalloprotease Rip3 [Flavobacteriales bacterium]MCC6577590.1 site-2 protease family protein [Flavobacteriales bacterium]NUQ14630.1 site-2 protease family protein [Flavobacteriales bacterium]